MIVGIDQRRHRVPEVDGTIHVCNRNRSWRSAPAV
jgi:hypothetical protein